MDKRKRLITWVVVSVVLAILCIMLLFNYMLFIFVRPFPVYETNDITDYGKVTGNYDNTTPKAFCFSFFPMQIDDNFKDVTYHYKAIKGDTYAYEMYLEFIIEEKEQYDAFIGAVVDKDVCSTFKYAPNYQEYIVSNYFLLNNVPPANFPPYIEDAEVGRVLFSNSKQKIIFVALGVYDGGGTNTNELDYFFDKFNIDPIDFEKQAWPGIH